MPKIYVLWKCINDFYPSEIIWLQKDLNELGTLIMKTNKRLNQSHLLDIFDHSIDVY